MSDERPKPVPPKCPHCLAPDPPIAVLINEARTVATAVCQARGCSKIISVQLLALPQAAKPTLILPASGGIKIT